MYISDKILAHGNIDGNSENKFVIIHADEYPAQAGMRRTSWCAALENAVAEATRGRFIHETDPGMTGTAVFIGVEVKRLREFRPAWCMTQDDVLAQYEAMQHDDRAKHQELVKAAGGTDIFKDPALRALASKLWSERVTAQVSKK